MDSQTDITAKDCTLFQDINENHNEYLQFCPAVIFPEVWKLRVVHLSGRPFGVGNGQILLNMCVFVERNPLKDILEEGLLTKTKLIFQYGMIFEC